MVARIKKQDTVLVLAGKDKDKKGQVIDIVPGKDMVMVKDVAVKTAHVKARGRGERSGIVRSESFISSSKVMPVCTSCKKACRVNVVTLENGSHARACNLCKETF